MEAPQNGALPDPSAPANATSRAVLPSWFAVRLTRPSNVPLAGPVLGAAGGRWALHSAPRNYSHAGSVGIRCTAGRSNRCTKGNTLASQGLCVNENAGLQLDVALREGVRTFKALGTKRPMFEILSCLPIFPLDDSFDAPRT